MAKEVHGQLIILLHPNQIHRSSFYLQYTKREHDKYDDTYD